MVPFGDYARSRMLESQFKSFMLLAVILLNQSTPDCLDRRTKNQRCVNLIEKNHDEVSGFVVIIPRAMARMGIKRQHGKFGTDRFVDIVSSILIDLDDAIARNASGGRTRIEDVTHRSDRGRQFLSIHHAYRLAAAGMEASAGSERDSCGGRFAARINSPGRAVCSW